MPLSRKKGGDAAHDLQGVAPRRPHAGLLRREKRALLRARETRLRDLGGLMVEMYSRGAFREDLLEERCAQVVGIDTRLEEIDELLHGRDGAARCTCGAPVLRGSHFCPNCGRLLDAARDASDDTMIERLHADREG